jgi:hypothetical protein
MCRSSDAFGARFRCRCGGPGYSSMRQSAPTQFAPGDMIAV